MSSHGSTRFRSVALALLIALYLAHYLVFTVLPYHANIAGISFAFARNLAHGEGLVAFPGGERVEGYSNPLWTFILAFFELVGVRAWVSSKILGAVFGAATIPIVWATMRRARGGRDDIIHWIPPFLLAVASPYVIWNASGLENSLFCLLMAAALYRTIREGMQGGWPLSAPLYLLLATTRPEAVGYAIVGLVAQCVFAVGRQGAIRRLLAWLLCFLVPYGLYQWWHYQYFGWPFPNTWYAMLGGRSLPGYRLLTWDNGGWRYLLRGFVQYGLVFAVPLLFVAPGGLRGRRGVTVLTLLLGLGVLLLLGGSRVQIPVQEHWKDGRALWVFGTAAIVGLMALGRPNGRVLLVVWATFCAAVLHVLCMNGDAWTGFRGGNLLSVPLFLVLGLGLGEWLDILPGWRLLGRIPVRGPVALAVAGFFALPNLWGSRRFFVTPETGVEDLRRRVDYLAEIQERLHLDHVEVADLDLGAHMLWSDWDLIDLSGIVDVPIAHHDYEKAFIHDYLFEEHHPDFIHSHGGWQRKTRINTFPEFQEQYFEIPGYPSGGLTLHVGNLVAKRHWVTTRYDGPPDRQVRFGGAITMPGWDIPSDIVSVGSSFFIQTWFSHQGPVDGFRVLVFLADGAGRLSVRETAPGYGWYPPQIWQEGEIVFTGDDLPIPHDLPVGDYKVGIVLLDEATGSVLAPLAADDHAPLYMRGEHLLPGVTLRLVSPADALVEAERDRQRAISMARDGDCDAAWKAWWEARRHVSPQWQRMDPSVATAMTGCLIRNATVSDDPFVKAGYLVQARSHDRQDPNLKEATGSLAAWFESEGDRLMELGDWDAAFDAFSMATRLDGSRAFARRKAETCRDRRL